MKYIILLLLITKSTFSYSQFFVGDTREKVKSALIKGKINFTENKLTDTTSRISWLSENEFQMIWVLDNKGLVTRQTLISEKENGINEFVKWFNKDFVIISPTEWRNYANGKIYQIKLEYLYNEPFFSITLLPLSQ